MILYHYILVLGPYRPGFKAAALGSSYELTCPTADLSNNYQYKFYTAKLSGLSEVILNENTKQFGHVLMKTNLKYIDSGLYLCSVYDQNGKDVKKPVMIGILSVYPRDKF